ncbi:MAG: mevalonate kinase [Thermoproteota archaeon]|nr:mevalonate kinase [Thermoproteota archaeon]
MVTFNNVTATSPGKSILFGEHFVVYGYSSIIFAINKKFKIAINFENSDKNSNTNSKNRNKKKIRIFTNLGFSAEIVNSKINMSNNSSSNFNIVKNLNKILEYLINNNSSDIYNSNKGDLNICINSEIPIGGGLGSSSAFCVSLIGAFYYSLNKKIDKKFVCEKSIELERIINQNTSGADCNICTFGGLGVYNKLSGFKKLLFDLHDLPFLIIDTGISHNTFEMVNQVKKFKENDTELFNYYCKEYDRIFNFSLESLKNKNLESLGSLMDENHSLLKRLSLSNSVTDKVVNICQLGGTFGTKITGSGGGGCVLSLIDKNEQPLVNRLLKKLDDLKLNYFFASSDEEGFNFEKTKTSIYPS